MNNIEKKKLNSKYCKKYILESLNNVNTLKKLIKFNKLIISGGGMSGILYLGAVKYINELNFLKNIDEYYGCSVGGLIVSLLSINYNIDELITFTSNFDFMMLVNPKINSLINNYSLADKNNYIIFLRELIKRKNIDPDINLIDLFNITKKKLNLIGFNISQQKECIFNYITHPNIELWKAIYITCALPTLFAPLLYEGDYYCDGVIVNNNPINLVKKDDLIKTLCITSSHNSISKTEINKLLSNKNIFNYVRYMSNLLLITFINKERYKINENGNIILINIDNCTDCVNFVLNKEQKFNKIMLGYNCCKEVLPSIIEYLLCIRKDMNSSEHID